MPRHRKKTEETREPIRDVAKINDAIVAGFRGPLTTDTMIADAVERHVKPFRSHRSEAIKNLCADTGISRKVLMADYAKYRIQEEAKLAADASLRDKIQDDFRMLHNALTKGGMLDFVDVLALSAPKPSDDEPENDEDDPRPAFLKNKTAAREAEA